MINTCRKVLDNLQKCDNSLGIRIPSPLTLLYAVDSNRIDLSYLCFWSFNSYRSPHVALSCPIGGSHARSRYGCDGKAINLQSGAVLAHIITRTTSIIYYRGRHKARLKLDLHAQISLFHEPIRRQTTTKAVPTRGFRKTI